MNNALSRIAVVLSVCALGVTLLRRPPPPPPAATAPEAAAKADDVVALRAQIAELRTDLAQLHATPPPPPPAAGVDEQRVRDLVREELAQRGPGRNQAPPDPAEIKKTLVTELGVDDDHAAKLTDL